jgi:hypothetical protein
LKRYTNRFIHNQLRVEKTSNSMRLNYKRQATQPQQKRRQLQLLSNSVFGVSNTINSRSTRLTNKKMFKSSVVGMQQQQQHHSQQLMRGGGNGAKTRPKYQQQQQQFQPQMRQFYAVTSPIKINSQFNQRGGSNSGGNSGQFNQFNYHRQTSQPQSLMSTRPRMAHHHYQHSYNNQVIDNNFRPMNSNSFLSFSNNAPQQQQQQFQHQHNYQTRFKHRQTAGKTTKLLSAPYNTTQYIMYDYSKRKTSSGEDAQKEQFEHDWDMQMQQTDDDVNEQFVCEPIRRSTEQPLDGTLSHSESNLDQTDSSNGQPQQPVVISQNDHEDVNMINRLSTSI